MNPHEGPSTAATYNLQVVEDAPVEGHSPGRDQHVATPDADAVQVQGLADGDHDVLLCMHVSGAARRVNE